MNELMRLLRMIPGRFRILAVILMLLPVILLFRRRLGIPTKVVVFVVVGLLVIGLLLLAFNFLLKKREKKKAQEFEDRLGVEARQTEVSKEEIQEALRELEQGWREAVIQLKEAGLSIYDLPWYLLIGEPQSGKSTTLKNSGIEFPVGADALSGAGGTRNCDWWFTNEGVILDTAGRFTFQEEMAPDRHEWDRFLGLLRQHRKHCPINGVIVVIPTTSLLEDSVEEQEQKAKNIRKKLLHLQKLLEIRFPVFVLVTKADRILGFTEHFHRLDPQTQLQMLGWSNPDVDKAWDAAGFPRVFGGIVERVHKLRLRLLREETNSSAQDKLFVFPEELDALQEPLAHYFHTIFAGSRFEEPFIFRGFYITSGVQQGRPIARACRDLLRVQVGDPQGVLEDLESVFTRSRAFFIRDFYDKKLFPEQGLVTRTRAAIQKERKYRLVLKGLTIGASAIALLVLALASPFLFTVLGPVNETVKEAERCLDKNKDCTLAEASRLIQKTEEQRQTVRSKTFILRSLLRGSDNEVTEELLPAIQAGLFRKEVLPDLLASFERRAGADLWRAGSGFTDYSLYHEAYRQLERLRTYQGSGLDLGRRDTLRRELSIDSIIRFCRQRPGVDKTPEGKAIDDWLEGPGLEEGGGVAFDEMLAIEERFDVADLEVPVEVESSRAAFRSRWTIDGLAPWQIGLRDHFETFEARQREFLDVDFDPSRRAEEILEEVAALTQGLQENLDGGSEHMQAPHHSETPRDDVESLIGGDEPEETTAAPAGDPLALGDPAPGWQEECVADFTGLGDVLAQPLEAAQIEERCGRIPRDWEELVRELERYEHLYQAGEGEGAPLEWSEPARKVHEALAELWGLATPEKVRQVGEEFADELRGFRSDNLRLEAVESFYERQGAELARPAELLEEIERSDPDGLFRLGRLTDKVDDLASLALTLRVLPPLEELFVEKFESASPDSREAEDWVPAASALLNWARDRLRPARGFDEMERPWEAVDRAQLAYVEDLVRDARPGGESGDSFSEPRRAAAAGSWSSFVSEIRSWRPVISGSGRREAEGIRLQMLEKFARDNDTIRDQMGSWRRRLGGSRGGGSVEGDIRATADEFKAAVRGLDDDPVEAWRTLAEAPELLSGFHAPSRAGMGTRGAAGSMRDAERRGARLLSEAIEPDYRDASRDFWADFEDCCQKFPFISSRELRRSATSELAREVTAGRRVVESSLDLETVEREDLVDLFDDFRRFEREFALGPILEGRETEIDFVGRDKGKLRLLLEWQQFLFGDEGELREQEVTIRLVDDPADAPDSSYIGERISRINFFGESQIRPGTPRDVKSPVVMNERELVINAVREGTDDNWESRLSIRGGPLKLFHFLLAGGERRRDGRTWRLTLDLPDYRQRDRRIQGRFDFTFDRPLPGVLSD